jgi:Ca2+-binding EF-hand superfamily protein
LLKDKDKDGCINDKEFLSGIEKIYNFRGKNKKDYPPGQCVRDIFRRIDDNGDCKLTKAEFIEGCLKNKTLVDLLSPFDF